MERIADGVGLVDLHHDGRRSVIAAAVLETDSGVAVIDPGPSATIPALRSGLQQAGLDLSDIRVLLATHIHLDHSGACGTLVRADPNIQVFVHQRGAPHMVDPSRLVKSATRLFGDRMDRLWGECLPIPQENLTILEGDEIIRTDGLCLDVAYTPGHASHHVSYFHSKTDMAFVGDTSGGRIRNGTIVLPATPPPDLDLDTTRTSLRRIEAWEPQRLFVTHFGPASGVAEHHAQLEERLAIWAARVRESLRDDETDEVRCHRFGELVGRELRETLDDEEAVAYERGAPPGLSWYGLARYWRKNT
ncbi:MAG: MBL fold metallo-hydrolase [Gemmatimonadetes bacterium]|nr:MBL fold metallo-hydrolase [Gemmatimonadota bacterium]